MGLLGLDALYPSLDELYQDLHRNPELSHQEEKTAAKLAARLQALGFDVTERVGGHGIVGVLRNGKGPTVLVRADMDALPIKEATGLPWASSVQVKDATGASIPVMHACGHDVHMASWVGAATLLAGAKETWRGMLLFVGRCCTTAFSSGSRNRTSRSQFMTLPTTHLGKWHSCQALCWPAWTTSTSPSVGGEAMARIRTRRSTRS